MTETPLSQEVARVSAPVALVESMTPEFGKLLPAHVGPERFARWALTCLRDPALALPVTTKGGSSYPAVMDTDAGRLSVMAALMDCASLGLEPGRTYHLIPFKGTVTGVVDYKGEIQLITNANPRAAVIAMLVHAADKFHMVGANIPPVHEADWFGDRGPITGGYSYVELGAGHYSMITRMSEPEFARHKAKSHGNPVWDEWPEAMRLKTLVHQNRKWVAWSAERQP